ncbi:hypothetical protein [Streptomyces sp. NPDC013457]|uniref:hypothetical protein n=1 Tax=Streptomyces sp. NPDC013457 TaxID=3364866 RepID=UPI0036F8C6A4
MRELIVRQAYGAVGAPFEEVRGIDPELIELLADVTVGTVARRVPHELDHLADAARLSCRLGQ